MLLSQTDVLVIPRADKTSTNETGVGGIGDYFAERACVGKTLDM